MAINAVASTADRALEIETFHENASGVIAPIAPLSLDGDWLRLLTLGRQRPSPAETGSRALAPLAC